MRAPAAAHRRERVVHRGRAARVRGRLRVSPIERSATLTGARVFLWVVASALLARISRAVGLWQEADANDGFVWLPLGLAADVLVGLLVVALVVPVARRWPRVGIAWSLLLGLAHVGWLGVNLVSFTLTQAPITFQRARGDEGVALDAHALLRFEDVVPAIGFAVLAVVALPFAWRLGARCSSTSA